MISAAAGLLPAAGLVLAVAVLSRPAAAGPAGATVQLQSALRGDRAWSQETEIGNLVADALRTATEADIALVAAGELREETLAPGNVTVEQLRRLLVNGDDPVAVLSLSGATIKSALELGVSTYPRKSRGFLQLSGLQFTFDASRPANSRILSVTMGGQPLQDGRQYRVAMSSTLAAGQYGYYRLTGWSREKADAQSLTMAGALEQYLKERRTLAPRLENRIIVKQPASAK